MSAEVQAFINRHATDVITSVKGTGIFPSVTMAQMIIESSGKDADGVFRIGRGIAVRKANNYFGIKADPSWHGPKVALSTPRDGRPVNYFRVYPSVLDSLKDHALFLLQNARYRSHGVFTARSPQEQTAALQRAGYAESPNYSTALNAMIAAYNLSSLDKVPEPINYKPFFYAAGGVLLISTLLYFKDDLSDLIHKPTKKRLIYG